MTDKPEIPRGKIIGTRIDPLSRKPIDVPEADHFYRCEACGGLAGC